MLSCSCPLFHWLIALPLRTGGAAVSGIRGALLTPAPSPQCFTIERLGRRPLIIVGFCFMGICSLGITISLVLQVGAAPPAWPRSYPRTTPHASRATFTPPQAPSCGVSRELLLMDPSSGSVGLPAPATAPPAFPELEVLIPQVPCSSHCSIRSLGFEGRQDSGLPEDTAVKGAIQPMLGPGKRAGAGRAE